MLPIDYVELTKEERTTLTRWFAQPPYQILREVLEAKRLTEAEEAMNAIVQRRNQDKIEVHSRQAAFYQDVLDLLDSAAQGYHDDNASDEFKYLRARVKT